MLQRWLHLWLFPDKHGDTVPFTLYAFLCVCSATMLARWITGRPDSTTEASPP